MIIKWLAHIAGKVGILLSALVPILAVSALSAQTPDRITLPERQMSISELFRQIERQTDNVVVVKSNSIDNDQTVTLAEASGTVGEILDQALSGTDQTWQASEGYIIIEMREPARPAPPVRPIIIDEGDLRRFVDEPQREPDSVAYRVTAFEPVRFGVDDKTFRAPGTLDPTGVVVAPFTTAERWQRSKFALKTNVLYGAAALAPNLRAELGLGNRTTLEAGLSYNGWNLNGSMGNNKKTVHGIVLAEFRYWLCERFNGHYFGAHTFGGFYNVGGREIPMLFEKEYRYEGTAYGAGVSWGYMVPLTPRWGVEFNVGFGVARLNYDKYGCDKCAELEGTYTKTYFGPTRAAINLVFIIK